MADTFFPGYRVSDREIGQLAMDAASRRRLPANASNSPFDEALSLAERTGYFEPDRKPPASRNPFALREDYERMAQFTPEQRRYLDEELQRRSKESAPTATRTASASDLRQYTPKREAIPPFTVADMANRRLLDTRSPVEVISRAGSTSDIEEYQETVSGARLFGKDEGLSGGDLLVQELQPSLFDEMQTKALAEKTDEGSMAYVYKSFVDPHSTLTPKEMAAKVKSDPELKQRWTEYMDFTRAGADRKFAAQEAMQSIEQRDSQRLYSFTTPRDVENYKAELRTARAFESPALSDAAVEELVKTHNPKLYTAYKQQQALDLDEPVSRLSEDLQKTKMVVGSGKAAREVMAGDYEKSLLRTFSFYNNAGQTEKAFAAQEALKGFYKDVYKRESEVAAIIKFGGGTEVARLIANGTEPERKAALAQVRKDLGSGAALANVGQVQQVQLPDGVKLPGVRVEQSDGRFGYRSNVPFSEIAKQSVALMQGKLSGAEAPAPEQVAKAMQDSIGEALQASGATITAFGKGASQEIVRELEWVVKGEFDEQAKKAFATLDDRKRNMVISQADAIREMGRLAKEDAGVAYKTAAGYAASTSSDLAGEMRLRFDYDESGAIDSPTELAAMYVSVMRPEAQPLVDSIVRGQLSGLDLPDGAQGIADAFSVIKSQMEVGMQREMADRYERDREFVVAAETREQIKSRELKKGFLVSFTMDPLDTTPKARFYADDHGREQYAQYMIAGTEEGRAAIRQDGAKHIAERSAVVRDAERAMNLLKNNRIPITQHFESTVMEGPDGQPVVMKSLSQDLGSGRLVPKEGATEFQSPEDWAVHRSEVLRPFAQYSDIHDEVAAKYDEAHKEWYMRYKAAMYGYDFDELQKGEQLLLGKMFEADEDSGAVSAAKSWLGLDELESKFLERVAGASVTRKEEFRDIAAEIAGRGMKDVVRPDEVGRRVTAAGNDAFLARNRAHTEATVRDIANAPRLSAEEAAAKLQKGALYYDTALRQYRVVGEEGT